MGHRVRQHRRDGAPVSTHALGKAPKGTQTKTSIKRRRRNKPSKAVRRWKLRSSLQRIGTIVILLAGRHRGKRAVIVGRHRFSGLLLITGPFKCNGIPVRRVHPDYVIATKTRIKIRKVSLAVIAFISHLWPSQLDQNRTCWFRRIHGCASLT